MPTKWGRIVRWGRRGSKFTEAFLEGGERVELSDDALAVVNAHDPTHALVFVERRGRFLRYVQWVGTPDEAVLAVQKGILRSDEVPEGVAMIGGTLLRLNAQIERDQSRRVEETLELLWGVLPDDCPTPARFFARLAEAVVYATDKQLDEVDRLYHAALADDGWRPAMEALSPDARRVGAVVRRARWPNPIDPIAIIEFWKTVPQAAVAIQDGVAALAERKLTEAQRFLLSRPLDSLLHRADVEASVLTLPSAPPMPDAPTSPPNLSSPPASPSTSGARSP